MSNLATLTPIRPSLAVVERQVADLDDGYTRIANELLEAVMSADLTARQLKVVLAVIRKTYGFGKRFDRMTNTQIAAMTGIHHTHVCKVKNEMIAMNIIVTNGLNIGVNKVISEWNFEVSQVSESLADSAKKTLANLANGYKPTQLNTKETIQKKKRNNPLPLTDAFASDEFSSKSKTEPEHTGQQHQTVPEQPNTITLGEDKQTVQSSRKQRQGLPVFDRQRLKDTWNAKAEQHGLPKIRSITKSTEAGLVRLWKAQLRQCRELGREPNNIDDFLNGYLEFGYQPTRWACGENPDGKRYGIETALRQEKIDEILARDD